MEGPGGDDWRNAERYAPLLAAERSIFAWEWLRRDLDYRIAAQLALSGREAADPALWGLHRFENPCVGAPFARPMWRAETDPHVLSASTEPARSGRFAFDIDALAPLLSRHVDPDGCHHLLISDGLRTIRVDLSAGSIPHGLVGLTVSISGPIKGQDQLCSLSRFIDLYRRGSFSGRLNQPERRAGRWIMELRAYDAQQSGVRQREIAGLLLAPRAASGHWRIEAPSLRSQVQRLARRSMRLAAGGYSSFMLGNGER